MTSAPALTNLTSTPTPPRVKTRPLLALPPTPAPVPTPHHPRSPSSSPAPSPSTPAMHPARHLFADARSASKLPHVATASEDLTGKDLQQSSSPLSITAQTTSSPQQVKTQDLLTSQGSIVSGKTLSVQCDHAASPQNVGDLAEPTPHTHSSPSDSSPSNASPSEATLINSLPVHLSSVGPSLASSSPLGSSHTATSSAAARNATSPAILGPASSCDAKPPGAGTSRIASSSGGWAGPTHPVSPKVRLAAAAATRATVKRAQASVASKPRNTKNSSGGIEAWPAGGATVPRSPRHGCAPKPRPEAVEKADKEVEVKNEVKRPVQEKRGAGVHVPTRPRSPRFRSSLKPLSAAAAARKAELVAEAHAEAEATRDMEERTKKRRAAWATTRTRPKSPLVLRRVSRVRTVPVLQSRFVARPMPDFVSTAPSVKMTAKSQAWAARRSMPVLGSNASRAAARVSLPGGEAMGRKALGRTVPQPFDLRGVEMHELMQEKRRRELEQEVRAERLRRVVKVTPLRGDILDGPTFVASRSAVPLTRPVDLLPHALERSQRTVAYQAAQRARVEEKERMERQAEMDRRERQEEERQREWQLKRFRARSIPESHYRPDMIPSTTGSISDVLSAGERGCEMEIGEEFRTPTLEDVCATSSGVQDLAREAAPGNAPPREAVAGDFEKLPSAASSPVVKTSVVESPAVEDEAQEKKRPSIFDGLRRSLSPLLGDAS